MKTATVRNILAAILAIATLGFAAAHQSIEVSDGAYRVTVGYLVNPAYTAEKNSIDLAIRNADGEFITGLEGSITAVVIGPDGSELVLTLRANRNKEGWYAGDFIPSVAGNYSFRISGFIGDVEFDELFDSAVAADPQVLDGTTITVP